MAPRLSIGAGTQWNVYQHVLGPDLDWRESLTREFWQRTNFRAGDVVEVHSSDHRIQYRMLVIAINPALDPIYFEVQFQPIFPADLPLPALAPQRFPRYEVRLAPGQGALFNIIDTSTGEVLNGNPLARDQAHEGAAARQRSADQAQAETLVDEFARSQRPVAPAPAPRPPAVLGSLHVHAAADGSWEVHGAGGSVVARGLDDEAHAARIIAALGAPEPADEGFRVADVVRVVERRPKTTRPRGRPRKAAPARSPEAPPPMAAAPRED